MKNPDLYRGGVTVAARQRPEHATDILRHMTEGFFANEGLETQLGRLRHGDHACSFYDGAAEQEALVISFVKEGLARGERCVYVVDDRTIEELATGLGRAGVNVSREQERGALQFISKAQWRNPGDFEIAAMAEGVKKLVSQALAPGWPGLWVAVEMTWALSPDIDPNRLAEWEAFWNNLITDMPAVLLCQYNRRRIPPAVIYLELKTHPLVVTPHEVYRNFYYEPPDLFLNQEAYGERVEWMLEQFQRARALEEERARRLQDQVARAQAEAAREQVTSILESITDGFFALDSQWHVTYLNKRAEQLLQIRREDLLGKTGREEFPPAVSSLLSFEQCQKAVAEQVAAEFEWFFPPLNTWFTVHVYPSHNGLSVYFHAITERKQAEEAGLRLAAIVESSDDAIISKSLDGVITSWNAAAERIFSYRAEEMIGQPILRLLPEDRQDEERLIIERLRQGECVDHFETVRRTKDGRLLDMSITISPLRNKHGTIIGASKIARDITERKRGEEALKAANAVLSQANTALRRSNEDLNQFAYAASHDLQEPLRMMAIYSQLLKKRYQGRLDGDADQFIEYIVKGAQRMEVLLKDLLEYSRVASMYGAQPRVPVDCNTALQKALSNLEASIKQSGASVTADHLPMVCAHDTGLLQLFQNLVGNAIKYRGKEPPQVHIAAERQGAEWVFSVRDNGIGIDPQYARQIFGIFKRLHGREYPGTGIGLAICQKIVERYEGRMWVESELGKGATFYFTIPTEKSHNE